MGRNESEKDDEIGLCRRRRDSTERAGVPQTGRRLSGMQAPPTLSLFLSFVGRAVGPGPPLRATPSRSPTRRSFLSAYRAPYGPRRAVPRDFTIHHYHRQLRHASASASARAYSALRGPCVGNARPAVCMYACVYDATSRPLMAISAAGHQRVPTGPNRPGQLASVTFARERASYLSLTLSLFLDLSTVAPPRDPLARVRFSSCEPRRFPLSSFFPVVLFLAFPLPPFLPSRRLVRQDCAAVPVSDISIPSESTPGIPRKCKLIKNKPAARRELPRIQLDFNRKLAPICTQLRSNLFRV